MLRVLIVDDHPLLRRGLRDLLFTHHPDWEFFEADNGIRAILMAAEVRPDLILMDHFLPKLDGIKATSAIKRDLPRVKIIMVTMSNPEDLVISAVEAGVQRIISKNAPYSEVLATIAEITNEKSAAIGSSLGDIRKTKKKQGERKDLHSVSLFLTDREVEVVRYMVNGYTSKKISELLGISIRTVDGHRQKILKKCNLHSTQEMLRFLISNRIIRL